MRKIILLLITTCSLITGCAGLRVKESTVGKGWAANSVNTVIFRNSAITSFKGYQFTAYYNNNAKVMVAKRKLGSNNWEVATTQYKGNAADAHNSISIAVDSQGYLHMAWDHHDNPLHYVRSTKSLGLELTDIMPMTGLQEEKVTYPEFHNLPNGKLLFCYRSGKSGRGNMVLNIYDPITQKWSQIQDNLLNGEGKRSAYWQMCVGTNGLHLSWVWRESWDVSTNHDICYAFSPDGGVTWQKSDGSAYSLPITDATAETVWEVPQNSSLINQTAITTDENNIPYIVTYWDNNGIPQYKIVYFNGEKWNLINTDFHKKRFSLNGGGTKKIPISRPELLVKNKKAYILFRDEERDSKISLAYAHINKQRWKVLDVSAETVGQWEPNFDKELWAQHSKLHIFSQNVTQADAEGLNTTASTPIKIIEINTIPK